MEQVVLWEPLLLPLYFHSTSAWQRRPAVKCLQKISSYVLEQSCSEVWTWVVSGKGIAQHHTCSAWPFPQMASIFRWGFWVLVSVSLLTQKETMYFLLKLVFWVTLLLKNGDLLEVQVPLLQCSGWMGQHVVASVGTTLCTSIVGLLQLQVYLLPLPCCLLVRWCFPVAIPWKYTLLPLHLLIWVALPCLTAVKQSLCQSLVGGLAVVTSLLFKHCFSCRKRYLNHIDFVRTS